MSRFAILLNGPLVVTDRLRRQLLGRRVFAADGGIAHAEPLALAPELWIGDFDSSSVDLTARYASVPRIFHPTEKDATDGALAIGQALALGADNIILVGALLGKADHALAHCELALNLARRGVAAWLTSGDQEAYPLLPGKHDFDLPLGSGLSIVPLADMEGLSIQGVRWPLENHSVSLGSTLTISNSVTGKVSISFRQGYSILAVSLPEGDLIN